MRSAGAVRAWCLLGAALLVTAACSTSSGASAPQDHSGAVPFTACGGTVACTGTIDGAAYEIVLPTSWNGTLLLYSHGYRNAQPAPPDLAPVETSAEPAPGWSEGSKQIGQALLDKGYAIAGSAYKSNGWAVSDGVAADEQLYDYFRTTIAVPARVYAWGDSLGGLITETLAEKDPTWVSGAAPLCGALAGVVPNMNLALDVSYGVKVLFDPGLTISGFTSYAQSVQAWTGAMKAVLAQVQDIKAGGPAKAAFLAALVAGPPRTQQFDGTTLTSQVSAYVEEVGTALGFGTFGRYDVEQRYGGAISGNTGTDYAARITAAARRTVDTLGGAGATDRYLAALAAGTRVTADPAAVARAAADGGAPQGTEPMPTVTLHTAADPLVIVQNESWFRAKHDAAVKAGGGGGGLVQVYTVAPPTYPQSTGAPYGAGHCNFTVASRLAVIDLLDSWVRDGVYPGPAGIATAMGPASGYDPLSVPGPWPAGGPA